MKFKTNWFECLLLLLIYLFFSFQRVGATGSSLSRLVPMLSKAQLEESQMIVSVNNKLLPILLVVLGLSRIIFSWWIPSFS